MKTKTFKITCYGSTKTYPESERDIKIKEFAEAVRCCEGSEKERYANILSDLLNGLSHAKDE